MTFRTLSTEEVTDFSMRYLKDELNQEDAQDLRRHLTPGGWMELQRQKYQADLSGTVTPITSGRTEEQIAKDFREDLLDRLNALADLMSRARREHGFTVNFGFNPPDSFGRVSLAVLEITKKLC